MKTAIHHTILGALLLLASGSAFAQIDFYESFAGTTNTWLTQDFETTDAAVCGTDFSFRANPTNVQDMPISVETVSPMVGISDGEPVVLNYSYKLLAYADDLPTQPLNRADWGLVSLSYGPTINGPWTQVDAITPLNHFPTQECTAREVTFTPTRGTEVYLRFRAEPGIAQGVNYFVYLDDVSALQEFTSGPIYTQPVVEVYPNPVTDFLNLSYSGVLSDIMVFDRQGQQVPRQDIIVNGNSLDMSGLAFGEYTLKLKIDDKVESIEITKK